MSYWKDRPVSAWWLGPTLVPHSFDGWHAPGDWRDGRAVPIDPQPKVHPINPRRVQ